MNNLDINIGKIDIQFPVPLIINHLKWSPQTILHLKLS